MRPTELQRKLTVYFSFCSRRVVTACRTMTRLKGLMVLMVGNLLRTFARGDTEVTCVFNSSCILPCTFRNSSDPVIHWIYMTAEKPHVHSYYFNRDQLGHQSQNYRGRTSLFQDQISRGNASLQLSGVKVQDEGRYRCYVGTIGGSEESFFNLETEAPVSEVNISQVGDWITCSSEGIYPEPELSWSTVPPSNLTLQNRTTVQQNEEQLYNISSSLAVSDNDTDVIYSCTIRTQRNQKTATLNRPTSVKGSETLTIACSSSDVPVSSFTWKFNHSQVVLTKTEGDASYEVSEEWRKHVKEVSESGSLTLQSLSSKQNGVYSCEVRNNEETTITEGTMQISEGHLFRAVVVGLFAAAVLTAVIGVVCVYKHKKTRAAVFQKEAERLI